MGWGRDVGGADAITVGDGGESGDVRAEEPAEGLGLGLAQLRELCGDMGDRAVMLADLFATGSRDNDGGIPVLAESAGERPGGALASGCGGQDLGVPPLDLGGPRLGKAAHGRCAANGVEVAKGTDGQIVVRLVEGITPGHGEAVDARGSAATAGRRRTEGCSRPGLDVPLGLEGVQVAADRRGRQTQSRREGTCCGRSALEQGARDPTRTTDQHFHNPNVTQLPGVGNAGPRQPAPTLPP